MMRAKQKSTSAVRIALMGISNRGKYIFLIMFALAIILFALFSKPLLKIFQINKPLMAKTGYGIPSLLTFNVRLKMKVNMIIIIRG
jgi:hypothetical protein